MSALFPRQKYEPVLGIDVFSIANFKRAGLVVFLFTFMGALAYAQASIGTMLGIVKDPSGASIPGATITITNADTTAIRTVTTGEDGAFRVPALPVGHYTLKIEKSGFQTVTQQGLVLDVALDLVVNTTLQVGTSTQEVVVTGEAPVVNTTNGSLGGLVNESRMADLPLNGRNYIDLTLLQPGIAFNSAQGSSGPDVGTSFSSNGAPQHSNNITLDGTSLVTQYSLGSASQNGTTLGVDGIKEYKVISNVYGAEYGMTMGSQVVMVSKGGSNNWHGDAFEYLRNHDLDARNFFDYGYLTSGAPRLPNFERNNFGGSFGGPIKKDKTFFYAVYEGLREVQGLTMNDTVPSAACHSIGLNGAGPNYQFVAANGNTAAQNAAACGGAGTTLSASTVLPAVMAPIINLFPSPNVGANNFTYPSALDEQEDFGQIRVDQNISASDSFFGRYTLDKGVQDSPVPFSSPAANQAYPQERGFFGNLYQFATLSENHIFSPSLLNTARVSFARTNLVNHIIYEANLTGANYSLLPGDPIGEIALSGFTAFGNTHDGTIDLQNIYTISDDLFYTKGRHAIKFGILLNRYNQGIYTTNAKNGEVTFSNLASFMTGAPKSIQGETPGSVGDAFWTYNTVGLYVQDDWRVTSRVTLNIGLRDEFMTEPGEINGRSYAFPNFQTAMPVSSTQGNIIQPPSKTNFSPRIGFGWDLFGNGKTALRGGFGDFFDVGNIGVALEQDMTALPPLSSLTTVNSPGTLVIPFSFAKGTIGNTLKTLDYNMTQPHELQYNMTVEQQLPRGVGLSVSYVGSRGLDLFTVEEGNPTIPSAFLNGLPYWQTATAKRVNPNWSSDQLIATAGDSWYNSLQVVVEKKLSHGLEVQGSYTYSRALDDTQGQQGTQDCSSSGCNKGVYPNNLRLVDKGLAGFDLRHRLFINLLYHFPNIKSDGLAAKFVHGWWMGNIITIQSGYPFTPILGDNRSNSLNLSTNPDRPNLATAADAAACPAISATCLYVPVPFNSSTVITGNPNQWFNPAMFTLAPMTVSPGGALCTTTTCPGSTAANAYGTLGNASRDMLEGPGMATWNFSVAKDTTLPFLGEAGNLEFRAEFFNILNRANFGQPNGEAFAGAPTDFSPYSEVPFASAGQITNTVNSSRQIQLALKVIF